MMRTTGLVWLACCALMACGTPSNNGGNGSLDFGDGAAPGGSCSALCARQAAAGCAMFTMGTCVSECQAAVADARCASLYNAAFQCASTATFTCNMAGRPTTMMCLAEGLAAFACSQDGGAGDASAD